MTKKRDRKVSFSCISSKRSPKNQLVSDWFRYFSAATTAYNSILILRTQHWARIRSGFLFCFVSFCRGGLLLECFQAHFIEYSDHCISSIVSDLLDGLSPSSHYIWGLHLSAGGKLAIMRLMWANLYRDGIRKSDKPRHKDLFVGNTE